MAKDSMSDSHVRASKAKIANVRREIAGDVAHFEGTREAVQRSQKLLERCRDPFLVAERRGDDAAARDRSPQKKRG